MNHGILVCVTVQKECEHLIREGERLARERKEPLAVLHVSTPRQQSTENRAATLNLLYSLTREAGADMETVEARSPEEAILSRSRAGQFSLVLLGQGPGHIGEALSSALGEEHVLVL